MSRGRCSLALVALLVAALPAARAQNSPRDDPPADLELRTDTVLVNVVVTEGAKFASGLTAADFAVREDGTAQKIDNLFAQDTPFAAAILLDTSGSMEY